MIGYDRHFNTIVIGVGGMGSATCYELAKRGQRVLGIERFDIPHDLGSSHGYTRIIRLAYYEHPSYVMLLKRAYELWEEIERRAAEPLLHICGSIDAGSADSWVFRGALRSAMEHDLPHEVLTGPELQSRFPGYRLPREVMSLYQPRGGFLVPERCTVAYVNAATALGAEIHGREAVLDYEPTAEGGVRVITDRAEYEADSLVLTAGSWNARLLPELRGLAVPERQVLAWFQPEKPEYFSPDAFPVFNLIVPEGRFYGFPVYGVPGFKVGKYHHFEERGEPEELMFEPHEEDEDVLRDFTSRYFPDAAGPTMTLKACMFTNSPDKHFIIDLHPTYPQISFAAGFSGHGYKFASVIGEIMADLAERGESRHDIRFFGLERLTGREPRRELHPYQQRRLDEEEDAALLAEREAWRERRALGYTGGSQRRRRYARGYDRGGERRRPGRYDRYDRRGARDGSARRRRPLDRGRDLRSGYFDDSTDPLYWEQDSVRPPW